MPTLVVEIEYDEPTDPYWMNPDSIKFCLEEVCKNSKFEVSWHEGGNPWIASAGSIDLPLALREKVFEAIGQASMCWTPRPDKLVFNSTEATEISDKLCDDIKRYFEYEHYYDKPEDKELPEPERNIIL